MYASAVDYLRPSHTISKIAGMFPITSVFDSKMRLLYFVYTSMLLGIPIRRFVHSFLFYYRSYRDIVYFATVIYITTRYGVHAASLIAPIVNRKTYLKLFKKLIHAEKLIHSLGLTQNHFPIRFHQYALIAVVLLVQIISSVVIYVCMDYTIVSILGLSVELTTSLSLIHI